MDSIKIEVGDNIYYVDYAAWQRLEDWNNWGAFNRNKYYDKYPEFKPQYPTKVILDEADKQPR